jgi:hypothetical protein
MATSTFQRDTLGRKLLTPGSNGFDSIGRAIIAGDKDALGRNLTAKLWAISTAFTLGQTMQTSNGIEYQCTVAGTTLGSGTGPTAPGYGLTVTDGTATWLQITTT